MNAIRNFTCLMLIASFVAVFGTTTATAQTANPKSQMVSDAVSIDKKITLLLPAVQKIRDVALRTFWGEYLRKCQAISKNVIRAGSQMSDRQFEQFNLDYIAANNTIPANTCDKPTDLEKSICECLQGGSGNGQGLTKCISDKQPTE